MSSLRTKNSGISFPSLIHSSSARAPPIPLAPTATVAKVPVVLDHLCPGNITDDHLVERRSSY